MNEGGGCAKVAWIDTEGTFRPDRIEKIAERFNLDAEAVLDNILVAKTFTHEMMTNCLVALAARFPLLVSAAHAGAAEVALWRAARGAATEDDREGLREGREGKARLRRRRCHSAHVAATAAAGVFFVAEEVAPDAPLMHAAWHVFGAAAILAANEATFGDRATRR